MGWQVKIKEEKGVTKYRIWTTVADGWITKWLTKEQMDKFWFWQRYREFREKLIEDTMTFPNKYPDKDSGNILYEKRSKDYNKFMLDAMDAKNFDDVVQDKFTEILKTRGIDMEIKDVDGYGFSTHEQTKTLEEIKNDLAKKEGYEDMRDFLASVGNSATTEEVVDLCDIANEIYYNKNK